MSTQMDHCQKTNTEHNNLRHRYRYSKCVWHWLTLRSTASVGQFILRMLFSNWERGKDPIDLRNINPQWFERIKSNIPDKTIYGDDWDFITEIEQKKESIYQKAKTILANKQKCTGQWKQNWKYNHQKKGIRNRRVMKECHQVGLKNDDPEDIKRRKELSNIVLSNNKAICKKKWKAQLKARLHLHES